MPHEKAVLWHGLAIGSGFVPVAVLSVGADQVTHLAGLYPTEPAGMTGGLFAVAATYRAEFTVVGGVVATVGPGEQRYLAALVLSGLGLLGGLAGLAGLAGGLPTPDLGPLWSVA